MDETSVNNPTSVNSSDQKDKPSDEFNKNSLLASSNNKKLIIFLGLGVIALLLVVGVSAYYLGLKNVKTPSNTLDQPLPTITKTTEGKTLSLFSGKLEKLSEDLKLTVTTKDFIDGIPTYYKAGTYLSGKYKGFNRYAVVFQPNSPSGPIAYVLASKDKNKFILDGDPVNSANKDDSRNPLYYFDKTKISSVERLDTNHEVTIPLDKNFALYRKEIITQGYGNNLLETDFSDNKSLSAPVSGLNLFDTPKAKNPNNSVKVSPADDFILGSSQVIGTDSTGLAYSYVLTTGDKISKYETDLQQDNLKLDQYYSSSDKNAQYPQLSAVFPNLAMAKNDITSSANLYLTYSTALPGACAFDQNTTVVNLVDNNLTKIGSSLEGDIYVLNDKNHALNKQEFNLKTWQEQTGAEMDKEFLDINKKTRPLFDDYVSQNPLLFIKDFWGRWIALGEYDYKLLGGCGKPVIYLYPTKPTEVSINFTKPISLDLSIPSYNNGWKILANPSGILNDLQPQFTDCSKIDSARKGSEYSTQACANNSYPYIYWAGQSFAANYPNISTGWIVKKDILKQFLSSKLDEIGFNKNEKTDFMSYWPDKMLEKSAKYYRISFLQTPDMNKIAPMSVSPAPQSIYRYFLDWYPLDEKPNYELKPQELEKIRRIGFTLVEWGGLK